MPATHDRIMTATTSRSKHVPLPISGQADAPTVPRPGEWRVVAAVTVLVLILTSAPYVFAYATAPADKQFMGLMADVPDHIQYFSWMRDLSKSSLASDRLTPEPNEPAYFNLLWWALGRLGVVTGLDYAALFTLLRIVAAVVCVGCTYAFFRITVPDLAQRRVALILFAFGGGLGIIWIGAKYLLHLPDAPYPFDTYTAEPNTFYSVMGFPHFSLALGLIAATFGLILLALREKQHRYAVAAGVIGLILGLQHAYDLVTIYAVLGLFGVLLWVRDRQFPKFLFVCGLIVFGLSLPPAAYAFLLTNANPVWREVLAQFNLAGAFTPLPWHLPIVLGVPFLLALFAFRPRMLQNQNNSELFVSAWFISHFALAYLPVDFQIHLLLGWQIPIAILAASILVTRIGPALARRVRIGTNGVMAGLIVLSVVTNVYLLTWRFVELRRYESPYYLSKDEIAALDWLAARATSNDVVLAELNFGQFVPMWSDARAFLAHWTGTLNYRSRLQAADAFVSGNLSEQAQIALLKQDGITYVVGSSLGSQSDALNRSPYLSAAFQQGPVTIYEVRVPVQR